MSDARNETLLDRFGTECRQTVQLSMAAWVEALNADVTPFQRYLLVGVTWMTTALPAGLFVPMVAGMVGFDPQLPAVCASISAFTAAYVTFGLRADPDDWLTDDQEGDE